MEMMIDREIEPLVREALARSVTEEPEKFDDAVAALAVNDDLAARSLALTVAIDSAALYSIHGGSWPDEPRLRYLAGSFANSEQWSNVNEVTALAFLTALATEESPLVVLPPGDVVFAALAIGGWLLSAFPAEEGVHWNNILDVILDKLESTPG